MWVGLSRLITINTLRPGSGPRFGRRKVVWVNCVLDVVFGHWPFIACSEDGCQWLSGTCRMIRHVLGRFFAILHENVQIGRWTLSVSIGHVRRVEGGGWEMVMIIVRVLSRLRGIVVLPGDWTGWYHKDPLLLISPAILWAYLHSRREMTPTLLVIQVCRCPLTTPYLDLPWFCQTQGWRYPPLNVVSAQVAVRGVAVLVRLATWWVTVDQSPEGV